MRFTWKTPMWGKNHGIVHNGTKIPLINIIEYNKFSSLVQNKGFTIFKVSPWINKSLQIITYSDKFTNSQIHKI